MADIELTVKALAEREQVTPRTVRRWISKGAVQVNRTPSGGIRVVDYRQRVVILDMSDDDKVGHSSR